jgi:hypothetical protein
MVTPAAHLTQSVLIADPPRIPGIYLCLVPIVVRIMV